MEALTRMVADSLARHGLDRPVDPRRLQWSRWFRCDSTRSLLVVPSKPGIFALAEEVMDLSPSSPRISKEHVGTAALGCPAEQSSASASCTATLEASTDREGPKGAARNNSEASIDGTLRTEAVRRLLAVLQFSEDDDMAFTLDRMFTRINPMRERLASGRCFLRFVVLEDQSQRRSICAALNQWMLSSAEKATGLPADFSSSLEYVAREHLAREHVALEHVARAPSPATAGTTANLGSPAGPKANVVSIDSGSTKNLHCPHPLPSGF